MGSGGLILDVCNTLLLFPFMWCLCELIFGNILSSMEVFSCEVVFFLNHLTLVRLFLGAESPLEMAMVIRGLIDNQKL